MGTVRCERCGGHVEADSIEEAAEKLDHAPGLSKGKPCDPARGTLVMVEDTQAPKSEPRVEKPKVEKPKVEKSKAIKSSEKEAS